MKISRSTADRVRPILQAMERSIESARRRRMQDTEAPARSKPMAVEHADGNTHEIPRRKARPKRATPIIRDRNGAEYRAEAG